MSAYQPNSHVHTQQSPDKKISPQHTLVFVDTNFPLPVMLPSLPINASAEFAAIKGGSGVRISPQIVSMIY